MKVCICAFTFLLSVQLVGQNTDIQERFKNDVREMMSSPLVSRAMDYIYAEQARTTEEHIYLTEIPAPPFKEMERAKAFMEMLRPLGVDSIWIDKVGNVLALKKGKVGQRTVALDAHLDTVFPEGTDVTVKIINDTLYAPGIGDDTRGLAMLLTIARTLKEQNIKLNDDLLIVASVGEEGLGDLRGVKHLFRAGGPTIDSWIAIDGGEIGRVNNKSLGSYRYRVVFKGPGGHSWGAFGLVNPHHALGDAMNRFVVRADEYTKSGPRTSYNIGVISGGTSVNSIPFESMMEIDTRSIDPSRLDSMKTLLRLSVEEATKVQNERKRLGGELTYEIQEIGLRPSGELSASLPLIQRSLAATAALGKRPRLTRGSTNSNIPISMNIPAVTLGRGGVGANAHALDEWWLDKEGYKSVQLVFLVLAMEAGL